MLLGSIVREADVVIEPQLQALGGVTVRRQSGEDRPNQPSLSRAECWNAACRPNFLEDCSVKIVAVAHVRWLGDACAPLKHGPHPPARGRIAERVAVDQHEVRRPADAYLAS